MTGINPLNVVQMLVDSYAGHMQEESAPSRAERQLAKRIKGMVDSAAAATVAYAENSCGLYFDGERDGTETEINYRKMFEEDELPAALSSDVVSQGYQPTPPIARNFVDIEYKRKAVDYWKSAKHGKRSESSVRGRYPKVRDVRQLRKCEETLTSKGSRNDKCRALAEAVWIRFQKAIDNHALVRELHLRRWALIENQDFGLVGFRASRSWAVRFEAAHRIVSRKVTKFVTTSYAATTSANKETPARFVESVIPYVKAYHPRSVYNSDQSGFQLSMHSGRILALIGAKHVEAAVQAVSATTHSYTIQPTTAADGSVISVLFMVLQETSGNFGPNVQKEVDEMKLRYDNVYIRASKSGKLTKLHLLEWVRKVYGPWARVRIVLLIDSWTTYDHEEAFHNAMPEGKKVTLMRIPPGTTGIIQQEDVYFFRPWKGFERTICDFVMLEGLDITLHHHTEQVKRQSLIWRPFCAPRYPDMIRYAFYACGYLNLEKLDDFENPVQYCFHGLGSDNLLCEHDNCGDVSFLRCSSCEQMLCFDCFYVQYHNCAQALYRDPGP